MRQVKLFIPLFIFLSLCTLFYFALFRENKGELPSALIDKSLPTFELSTVKEPGRLVTEKDMIGEAALINVWGTWCPSCRVEHPYLVELSKQGVPIYGVNYKDDQDEARIWLKTLEDPYRFSVNDELGVLGVNLGVYGAPETYLIDAEGIIRFKHVGVVDERVWKDEIEPLYNQFRQTAGGEG
ncbi:thiol:disulfide interchange protein [Endozoicomonas sp. (ex Bugula neritina AB1)]|nr:thiol:disulfide interchange protein [Endozoicomonas sp. (ex Bugula neritina AB1)]